MNRWHWLGFGVVLIFASCSRPAQPPRRVVEPAVPPVAVPPLHAIPKTKTEKPTTAAATPVESPITLNAEVGILSGRVVWDGPEPTDAFAGVSGDRTITVGGQRTRAQPTPLLRVTNRGVADAVVWLLNPPSQPTSAPNDPVTLSQRNGDFQPHVEAVLQATRLRLATTDDQADFRASGAAEFGVNLLKGKMVTRKLQRAGLVEIHSEVHPWMSAYVWVFEHNFFARTNANGEFRLPAVPPGAYQVVVWHEGWRFVDSARYLTTPGVRKTVKVNLGPKQGAAVRFMLSDRDALAGN
jgi:hypothetical protein